MPGLLEPYEKSLIRGPIASPGRWSRKSRESAEEQAPRMFVGWVRKVLGKGISEAWVREAKVYLDELVRADRHD